MSLRALVSSDIVLSPSSNFESLSVSFGRFVFFKYSFRFISDSGSSLLLYNFCKKFQLLLQIHFDLLICVLLRFLTLTLV